VTTVFAGRHRPHEVMIIVWSVTIAAVHFVTDPPPNSLDATYPAWLVGAWYLLLGTGGVLGLTGLWLRSILVSLYLERASMIAIAAGAAIYGIAAFYVGGWRALVAGGLIGCWSAACAWRAIQISVDVHRLTRGAA
jgi:predicted membrane channel-forming protein YqfA (hemolysin III family)